MDAKTQSQPTPMKNLTNTERKSERELVVTRTVNGPARIVFDAWTNPDLFKQWWVPKSCGLNLLSCELDVRVGGKYRLVFSLDAATTMAFFGTYLEVIPHSRLVWTNEEGDDGEVVTTVTFEERSGKTLVVVHDLYPSKAALDAAIASGATSGMPETLDQLDELLATLSASALGLGAAQ
ncbi:MAG TPA: SRPBCC family protein [Polyangiaceae bacterium]